MRRFCWITLLLAWLPGALGAADPVLTAKVDGRTFTLQSMGGRLTGTAGTERRQIEPDAEFTVEGDLVGAARVVNWSHIYRRATASARDDGQGPARRHFGYVALGSAGPSAFELLWPNTLPDPVLAAL